MIIIDTPWTLTTYHIKLITRTRMPLVLTRCQLTKQQCSLSLSLYKTLHGVHSWSQVMRSEAYPTTHNQCGERRRENELLAVW